MLNLKQHFKNHKKLYILLIALIIIAITIFLINFNKNNYKTSNYGNNITNIDEVEKYILNISSYKATMEVTIKSNKNTNKYILKQTHKQQNEQYEDTQEVIEPENIKGLKIIYQNGTLEIKNIQLELTQIYSNYPYIEDNNLWLNSFINDYKNIEVQNKKIIEENDEIKITLETKNDKKIRYKELYLDKKTGKPTKLLLKDSNQNETIYILYTEIELSY